MRHTLFFEKLLKLLQLFLVNVRNSPVVQVRFYPVQKLITLARYCLRSSGFIGRCRPNKQVNKMFASLVNQRSHRPVIQIIQTATNQWESFIGKVHHRRGKIELGIQPGFYSVLIRRTDVGEVVCHQRTHMTGDELRRQELIGPRSLQSRHQVQSDDRGENDSGREAEAGETWPIPWCPPKTGPQLWLVSSEHLPNILHNIPRGPFRDLFSQRGLNSLT